MAPAGPSPTSRDVPSTILITPVISASTATNSVREGASLNPAIKVIAVPLTTAMALVSNAVWVYIHPTPTVLATKSTDALPKKIINVRCVDMV